MKKILVIMLAAVCGLFALSSCGGKTATQILFDPASSYVLGVGDSTTVRVYLNGDIPGGKQSYLIGINDYDESVVFLDTHYSPDYWMVIHGLKKGKVVLTFFMEGYPNITGKLDVEVVEDEQ